MTTTTRENDMTLINSTEESDLYQVHMVGRCWIPQGEYTIELRHADGRAVARQNDDVIAIVKGIPAAKAKVMQHVPRQFRTRIESTWLRYYPQYWADGRWHNLTNSRGEKLSFEKRGEAHMELLIFLARQRRLGLLPRYKAA